MTSLVVKFYVGVQAFIILQWIINIKKLNYFILCVDDEEGTLNLSSSPSESSLFSPYEKDSDAGKAAPPVGKLPQHNGVDLEGLKLPTSGRYN